MANKFLQVDKNLTNNVNNYNPLTSSNHLIPEEHDEYTLGSVEKRWKEIHAKTGFFDDQTLHLGNRWKITVDESDPTNSAIKVKHSHHGHHTDLEHENDRDIVIGNVAGNHGTLDEDAVKLIVQNHGLELGFGYGDSGQSAYELALQDGFSGTLSEWLDSLKGDDGLNGLDGTDGVPGDDGISAYQVAVNNGFSGTENEWLDSLKGDDGADGVPGADGISAYQVATNNGFSGTETEWLESLIGDKGDQGIQGIEGPIPDISHIQQGIQGPAGVVEGLDDILARITALEQYSPLTNVSNGAVSDITYKNKEEIVFDEQLENTSITGVGGATPWTPDAIGGMKLWLDASDLTSVPTTWTDKSGQGNIMTHTGSPTLETDANSGLKTIHYAGPPDKLAAAARITGIRTVFWVFNRDAGTDMNTILSDTENVGPFFRDNGTLLWKFNNGLGRHESNRAYVNGFRNPTTHGGQKIPHELSVLAVKSNRYGGGMGVLGIGDTLIGDWYRTGFQGNLGELILFDSYLDDADIAKVEGYLAHKWNLNSDLLLDGISDHPHLTLPPMDEGGIILDNWTKSSGSWDAAQLSNGILQGYGTAVSIRQSVTTLPNEIYEVAIVRGDSEEGLIVKLRTSTDVEWLTHNNDITHEVDIPYNTVARFKNIANTTTNYIELDTVNADLQITSCSLKRMKIASGTVEVLTNNTIKKSGGVDGWNAGASSTEFINGQGEGYVQFQMAQSGKDIKVGLVYEDVDYTDADPFEMTFSGVDVYIGDVVKTSYVSGDWFRIKHDSVNNQIVYQKRDSNLDYQTFVHLKNKIGNKN